MFLLRTITTSLPSAAIMLMDFVLWLTQNRLPVSQSQARPVIPGSPVEKGQARRKPSEASVKKYQRGAVHFSLIATYRCKAWKSAVRHSCKCCPCCRPRRTHLGPRQRSEPLGWGPRSGPHQSVETSHSQVPMSLSAQSEGWQRHLEGTVISSSIGMGRANRLDLFSSKKNKNQSEKDNTPFLIFFFDD